MEIFINKMEGERMTQVIQESVKMLEMLPESEQELASQLIKRLVLACVRFGHILLLTIQHRRGA